MQISLDSELAWLHTLPYEQRLRFLALLAHSLTIALRVMLGAVPSGPAFSTGLKELNEALHQVTGYVSACLNSTEHSGFLHGVVVAVLRTPSGDAAQQAAQAWSYAKSQLNEA